MPPLVAPLNTVNLSNSSSDLNLFFGALQNKDIVLNTAILELKKRLQDLLMLRSSGTPVIREPKNFTAEDDWFLLVYSYGGGFQLF